LHPDTLFYHEGTLWLKALPDDVALIGLTHFAQQSVGSAIRVELPETGAGIAAGRSFGLVEANKTAYELVAPASGTILGVNTRLAAHPGLVNAHPYTEGWLLRVRLANRAEIEALMNAAHFIARFALEC
jgi:glycine cleavage system H protein